MPETEQQDKTLSELVVKEAIGKGLDTPLRESILEAVDESEAGGSDSRVPLAGALFGLGAAVGFLAGRHSPSLEETPLEDLDETELIDVDESDDERPLEVGSEETDEAEEEGSSSRLARLVLVLGAIAGIALLRRRLGDDEDDWEPIEEFEPATSIDADEGAEATDENEADADDSDDLESDLGADDE
ncbi:hypothetical protein EA462_16940 [Natrarchaeobius halalkaliphilus]|uniref:MYXO-CTERM domain-containing protein n=1 Tax=Natrarchaeobius halalkaliphilus TaxID=1679091 RepID=A0A3N6LXZ7_9EURY|nr:hypothetical protein [Natrarchaeobius halalkaliphilus]RQG86158.1 hypothetical protein EA462_16940 [Natrarchaeobius halalkaliphilus]